MENRKITFNLPADLIRQAKMYAAEHGTTVNCLVHDLLQERLGSEARGCRAAVRLLAIAERGPYFMVDPGSIRREELYERH